MGLSIIIFLIEADKYKTYNKMAYAMYDITKIYQ